MMPADIKVVVKSFILREFLWGEPEDSLSNETRLISDGIIDSMGSLRLVSFLEETFDVLIKPHHVDPEHLDTLNIIVSTVIESRAK